MIAKKVDYQLHYDEFIRRHRSDRSLRMARYCDEAGIRRQRMYEWMTRRGLSLKSLYADVSAQDLPLEIGSYPPADKQFAPLEVSPSKTVTGCIPRQGMVRITFPNGVGIELDGYSVEELMVLTGGPLLGSHV